MAAKAERSILPVRVRVEEGEGRRVRGRARTQHLEADFPEVWGGTDAHATPLEQLAFALGACFVATARTQAILRGLPLRSVSARVEGDLDLTTPLADPGAPIALPSLSLRVDLEAPWSPEEKRAFLKSVARRCPVCHAVGEALPLDLVCEDAPGEEP